MRHTYKSEIFYEYDCLDWLCCILATPTLSTVSQGLNIYVHYIIPTVDFPNRSLMQIIHCFEVA